MHECNTRPTGSPDLIPISYPIPLQLRLPELRFIKIVKKDKIPAEKDYIDVNNYSWNNPTLIRWINDGGNYGVLPRGGISVIDLDDLEMANSLAVPSKISILSQLKVVLGEDYIYM